MQALAIVLSGAQAVHTISWDEAIGIPTEESSLLALRTQQILAYETGVARTADPLGGSYYVESLTDELEQRIQALIAQIEDHGGVVAGIEDGSLELAIANRHTRSSGGSSQASTRSSASIGSLRRTLGRALRPRSSRLSSARTCWRVNLTGCGGSGPSAMRLPWLAPSRGFRTWPGVRRTRCPRPSTRSARTRRSARSHGPWPACSGATRRRPRSDGSIRAAGGRTRSRRDRGA